MPVDPKTFLLVHLLLSLVGLLLVTTVLTSATGFGLPSAQILTSHIVGAHTLPVLLGAIVALYLKHLQGAGARASSCSAWPRLT
jgi:hypothetical protein